MRRLLEMPLLLLIRLTMVTEQVEIQKQIRPPVIPKKMALPAAQKTWLILPLGIAAFIVFYVVFRIAITKFDLKTPGREDDDIDEENIALANDDYTAMASVILEGLGGSANVKSVDNCITRLRLEINDDDKVNEAGAAGIIRPGKGNIQVIIGPKVQFVADEMEKLCK